jgi:hypothetical protein
MAPGFSPGRWLPVGRGRSVADADSSENPHRNGNKKTSSSPDEVDRLRSSDDVELDLELDPRAAAQQQKHAAANDGLRGALRFAETPDKGGSGALGNLSKMLGLAGRALFVVAGLFLLAFILFIVVICLAVSLSGRRTFDESHVCLEPACLTSSALVSTELPTLCLLHML